MKQRSVEQTPAHHGMVRTSLVIVLGICGVIANNWWAYIWFLAPVQPSAQGMLSDLEVRGQPGAELMGALDVVAGVAFLLALLIIRPSPRIAPARRWLIMYSLAAIVGGLFPYECAEGLDAACRRAEWMFQLPAHHYIHVVSGIVAFAAGTIALIYLIAAHGVSRYAYWVIAAGYGVLALSYLVNRYGMLVEPLFMIAGAAAVMWCLCADLPWMREHPGGKPRGTR